MEESLGVLGIKWLFVVDIIKDSEGVDGHVDQRLYVHVSIFRFVMVDQFPEKPGLFLFLFQFSF